MVWHVPFPSIVYPDVTLNHDQTEDYARILGMFQRSHSAMDLSEMGCGKTFLALKYAKATGALLFVICKAANVDHWTELCQRYGITAYIISYNKFRGTTRDPPSHGYLEMEVKTKPGANKTTIKYTPTQSLTNLIQHGALFVLDEFQEIRNATSTNKAVKVLTSHIRETPQPPNCLTRYLGLSALPACKVDEIINIMRGFGLIKKRNLYRVDPITRQVVLEGLQDLINNCMWYDSEATQKILDKHLVIGKNNAKDVAVELYMEVIKPKITTSMPELVIPGIKKDYRNGFFELFNGSNPEKIRKAINQISSAARFDGGETGDGRVDYGTITKGLIQFYNEMVPTTANHAKKLLEANPNAKYIYFCMNTEPLEKMAELLKEYHPMILNGKTPKKERKEMKEKFNRHTNEHRVLLTNCNVGGVGTSFHDTSPVDPSTGKGQFPRYVHIMPHYSFLTMVQCSGRTYRIGATSDTNGWFVFGSEGMVLMQVLESLITKAHWGREIVEVGDVKRSKMPSDWRSTKVVIDAKEVEIATPRKANKQNKKETA